jgi:sugar lactone lactonase YvrE
MKPCSNLDPRLGTRVLAFLVAVLLAGSASAQIFVSDYMRGIVGAYSMSGQPLVRSSANAVGPIGIAYDGQGNLFVVTRGGSTPSTVMEMRTSGRVVNSALISGLPQPQGIALDGNGHIFISEQNVAYPDHGGTIAEYTTSGQVVNSTLIVGDIFTTWQGLACDGQGHLYAASQSGSGNGIDLYTTTGNLIQIGLISGLSAPHGIALDGQGHVFVANFGSGTVGEYTTSGQTVNAALISGLDRPSGIALDSMGDLFVSCYGSGTIGEYTTSGAVVNASLVSGLSTPYLGLVVVPEPSSLALAVVSLGAILLRRKA